MIGLKRLHKTLFNKVAFDHRGCILHKAIESFPSGLCIVLPFDFQFNQVLIFDSADSMANYSFHAVPAPLLGLFGLRFGAFSLFKRPLLVEFLLLT